MNNETMLLLLLAGAAWWLASNASASAQPAPEAAQEPFNSQWGPLAGVVAQEQASGALDVGNFVIW